MKKRIRIQGFFIFLSVIASILLSKFVFPSWESKVWDEICDAFGIGIILFGLLVRIASRGLKQELSEESKALVTSGLYGLVRNPMYFGTLLIGSGVVLVLFQWWAFFLFLAVFLTIYIPQVRKEEKKLSARFGRVYEEYCATTPRFFPNALKLLKADPREYLFFRREWIFKELPSLVGIITAIIAIEMWEDVRLFGHKGYTKEVTELFLITVFFVAIFSLLHDKKGISGK